MATDRTNCMAKPNQPDPATVLRPRQSHTNSLMELSLVPSLHGLVVAQPRGPSLKFLRTHPSLPVLATPSNPKGPSLSIFMVPYSPSGMAANDVIAKLSTSSVGFSADLYQATGS